MIDKIRHLINVLADFGLRNIHYENFPIFYTNKICIKIQELLKLNTQSHTLIR
jgi:hypothetical protein